MSKHIHDGRSHCPACALEKIGRQKQEIADLEAENARLQARVEAAEAAVEKGGMVIYNGVSVPKRDLDDAKAEHARRCQELVGYKALAERRREALEEAQGKLKHCGQENCMGYKLDDAANWVREERLIEARGKLDAVRRVGEDYFRMGVGDVAYELRNALLRTKEDE